MKFNSALSHARQQAVKAITIKIAPSPNWNQRRRAGGVVDITAFYRGRPINRNESFRSVCSRGPRMVSGSFGVDRSL
jgi:hypothetical protein